MKALFLKIIKVIVHSIQGATKIRKKRMLLPLAAASVDNADEVVVIWGVCNADSRTYSTVRGTWCLIHPSVLLVNSNQKIQK